MHRVMNKWRVVITLRSSNMAIEHTEAIGCPFVTFDRRVSAHTSRENMIKENRCRQGPQILITCNKHDSANPTCFTDFRGGPQKTAVIPVRFASQPRIFFKISWHLDIVRWLRIQSSHQDAKCCPNDI